MDAEGLPPMPRLGWVRLQVYEFHNSNIMLTNLLFLNLFLQILIIPKISNKFSNKFSNKSHYIEDTSIMYKMGLKTFLNVGSAPAQTRDR